MDPCSVCESTIYHQHDGMIFCAICGTKYEGAQEMEADTENDNSIFNRTRIKQKKKEKSESITKQVVVNNKYELLQMVLQQQVDALIKLGANPHLKDVVFRIWAKYLEQGEVAFYDQEAKSTKSTKKKTGKKTKIQEGNQVSSSSKVSITSDDPHGSFVLKYDYTLAFCHLGLMFTNPLTMVSDLIRWVKEYKVPFLEGAECIPESYTLSAFDKTRYLHSSFHLLNSKCVLTNCMKILKVVEIQDFPEVSLIQVIKKYIILLNLPDEMHCLAARLVQSRGFQMSNKNHKLDHLSFSECTAVSYIVVMLKMIFGLDDKTERELSSCTRELMKLTKNKHQLFVFDDWMKCMNLRMAYNFRRSMAMTKAQEKKVDDVLEHLFKGSRSGSQKALGPLDTLSKIWKKGQTGDQSDDGKEPIEENMLPESDFLKNMQHFRKSSIQHVLHRKGFTDKLDKFNLADVTLGELFHSTKSHEEMESKCNCPYPTLHLSTCVKHMSDEMITEENSELNNGSRTNFDLVDINSRLLHCRDRNHHPARKRLKVTEEGTTEKECRLSLKKFLVSNMSVTEVTDQEQFSLVCRQIQATCDMSRVHYELSDYSKSLSYLNLLKICCSLIETEPHVLHASVVKAEQTLFVEKDKE